MIYTKTNSNTTGGVTMRIEEISVDAAIELDVRYQGKFMNFRSKVVLVRDMSVLINSIKVGDQKIGFTNQCFIQFLYKVNGKVYLWENVSVSLVKFNGVVYHKVDLMGEGKQYNRRNAYRLYVGEEMPIYMNTTSGLTAVTVLLKDISETGIGFISKDELNTERMFRFKFKNDKKVIDLSGMIIRKEYLEHLSTYLYGGKFGEKNPMLSNYIANCQSDELKRRNSYYSASLSKKIIL